MDVTMQVPATPDAPSIEETAVADLTDTQLLDAMDTLGQLFGGDPEDGPEGTEWRIEGYATGSLRDALRQELDQARARARSVPLMPPSAGSVSAVPDDDDMPF